jgi:hypothetical protein
LYYGIETARRTEDLALEAQRRHRGRQMVSLALFDRRYEPVVMRCYVEGAVLRSTPRAGKVFS